MNSITRWSTLISITLLGSFWAVVALQYLGIAISFLRAFLAFLLLTFVPGLLLISTFKLKTGSIGESILYCVGSSISFLVLASLFISLFYPAIGITNPLEPYFFMLNITIILLFLLLTMYIRERNFNHLFHFSLKSFEEELKACPHIPFTLLVILLPLFSTLAAYTMNFYGNNILMFLLLLTLAIIPVITLAKNIPDCLYPITLYAISLSLLFHNNLISNYVIGADIQVTFFYSNLIRSNLSWDTQVPHHGSLITISVIPAIYSLILGSDLHSIFKIVYSLLYSFSPVGIFYAFRRSFGSKEAFLAGVFFSFYWRFYHDTPGKEAMAHFFMILFLMLITDTITKNETRAIFAILFLFSMVTSHYGTSYIFLIAISVAYIILLYIQKQKSTNLISLNLIGLFGVTCIAWYLFTGSGFNFSTLIRLASHFKYEIMAMFTIEPRTGAYLIVSKHPVLKEINLLIYIILTLFVGFGILKLTVDMFRQKPESGMNLELGAIAIPFFFFLCSSGFIYGPQFGIDRAYYLSLVVLSPFLTNGYKFVIQFCSKILKRWRLKKDISRSPDRHFTKKSDFYSQRFNLLPLAILLATFLLFNTGLIYQIAGSPVSSAFALNKESNGLAYSDSEMAGAKWLNKSIIQGFTIYSDDYSKYLFFEFYPPSFPSIKVSSLRLHPYSNVVLNLTDLPEKCLIYIRTKSISDTHPNDPTYLNSLKMHEIEIGCSKIYDNGGSKIFCKNDNKEVRRKG